MNELHRAMLSTAATPTATITYTQNMEDVKQSRQKKKQFGRQTLAVSMLYETHQLSPSLEEQSMVYFERQQCERMSVSAHTQMPCNSIPTHQIRSTSSLSAAMCVRARAFALYI